MRRRKQSPSSLSSSSSSSRAAITSTSFVMRLVVASLASKSSTMRTATSYSFAPKFGHRRLPSLHRHDRIFANSTPSTLGGYRTSLLMWGEAPPNANSNASPKIPGGGGGGGGDGDDYRRSFSSSSSTTSRRGGDANDVGGVGRPTRPPRRGGVIGIEGGGGWGGGSGTGGGGGWFDDEIGDASRDYATPSSSIRRNTDRGGGRRGGGTGDRLRSVGGRGGRGRGGVARGGGGRYDGDDEYDGYRRGRGGRGGGGRFGGRGRGGVRVDHRDGGARVGGGGGGNFGGRDGRGGSGGRYASADESTAGVGGVASPSSVGKINLRAIENAGYEHLYGIAPVLNALKAGVRDFTRNDDDQDADVDVDDDIDDDYIDNDVEDFGDEDYPRRARSSTRGNASVIKPEARLSPRLFVQEGTLGGGNTNNNGGGGRRTSATFDKSTARSDAKREASHEILNLASTIGLPIIEVDKGVLNALCGSRPHQGYVLRCGTLDFVPARRLRGASTTSANAIDRAGGMGVGGGGGGGRDGPSLWLALDEVVDPQNLGALLRSAYFLGGGPGGIIEDDDNEYADDNDTAERRRRVGKGGVGILVCSKNSSPLSPTVSAASAGALEFMTIYSTSNLPKLLNSARDDGWTVLGAAADVPDGAAIRGGGRDNEDYDDDDDDDEGNKWDLGDSVAVDDIDDDENPGSIRPKPRCFDLNDVKTGRPTIIVLGSEGRGLRTLVARACSGFVRIPGGGGGMTVGGAGADEGSSRSGVDSLNVSVTGGILLWHFLSGR